MAWTGSLCFAVFVIVVVLYWVVLRGVVWCGIALWCVGAGEAVC